MKTDRQKIMDWLKKVIEHQGGDIWPERLEQLTDELVDLMFEVR